MSVLMPLTWTRASHNVHVFSELHMVCHARVWAHAKVVQLLPAGVYEALTVTAPAMLEDAKVLAQETYEEVRASVEQLLGATVMNPVFRTRAFVNTVFLLDLFVYLTTTWAWLSVAHAFLPMPLALASAVYFVLATIHLPVNFINYVSARAHAEL